MLDAIVLVGGRGTRLQSVVNDRPKPMARVGERPFLEWLLLALRAQGLRQVILAVGYQAELVSAHFGDGSALGLDLRYSHETSPLGTGGATRLALEHVRGAEVLVLNGDSYCPFDVAHLLAEHRAQRATLSLWLVERADGSRYGSVQLDAAGRITAFREKTPEAHAGLINAGVYLMHTELLRAWPAEQMLSLETQVFPQCVAAQQAYGVVGPEPFIDIGTPEAYAQAATYLQGELQRLTTPPFDSRAHIQTHLRASATLKQQLAEGDLTAVITAAQIISAAFRAGRKLLICGNGGSAADAQHMAAEFVSLLVKEHQRPGLPAMALTTDTSFLTAYANDFGFEGGFARQVQALGQAGDVLLGISTSGNSKNVIRAMETAKAAGLRTIGLLGLGGALTDLVECAIVIPHRQTQYIQESMLTLEHIVCELVEAELFNLRGDA